MFLTDLTEDQQEKVPAGAHTFITYADAMRLTALPVGERPRIYAYCERGTYAGQIVSLPSPYALEKYAGDLGFAWISGVTLADLIRRA